MLRPRLSLAKVQRLSILVLFTVGFVCGAPAVNAQCPPTTTLVGGLLGPTKLTQSPLGNLFVAETGPPIPNSGRVSIVGLDGTRRTLLAGLPSGESFSGAFGGTNGVFLHGRTLYVLNPEGNSSLPGPIQGTQIPNPHPNSPILSSVLAVHLSAAAEKITTGFTLTLDDHQALKDGETLRLSNGKGDKITVELLTDVPDFVPDPLPFFSANVRASNPFGIVGIGDQLYVADGGRNLAWRVDVASGDHSVLAIFPPIPNPLPFGPPVMESVPAGINVHNGQVLVALFRGFPFAPGSSDIVSVDPLTGTVTPFIDGLSSAIDVVAVKTKGFTSFLTLELSQNFLADAPGRLQRFATPAGPGVVISNCLISPSDMVRDAKTGTLYIASIFTGQILVLTGQ